jgi:hypothetical protein
MLWIRKGLFVSSFQHCKTFPLPFDNERVSGESSNEASATPLGRKAQLTLNRSKLLIQLLQLCPLAGSNHLDLAFYDNHIALSLGLERSGLSAMRQATDQNL